MAKKQIIEEKYYHNDNDELDIADLFIKIWRWKWIIATIVAITTTATFLYLKLSPNPLTYTAKASLKIGRVGNYAIQNPDLIIITVKNQLYTLARQHGYFINDITPLSTPTNNPYKIRKFNATVEDKNEKFLYNLNLSVTKIYIDYSIQSPSSNNSVKWAREIGDYIINYHRPLYVNAVKQAQIELTDIKKMSVHVNDKYIKMKLMYENQKYPTSYTFEPLPPIAPDASLYNKMILKTVVSLIASLLFGIFLSLLIDFSLKIKEEIRLRKGK